MSRDMKRRGFRFVGPTVCYAFMQAAGLVNDHTVDCDRYAGVQRDAARISRLAPRGRERARTHPGADARAGVRGGRRRRRASDDPQVWTHVQPAAARSRRADRRAGARGRHRPGRAPGLAALRGAGGRRPQPPPGDVRVHPRGAHVPGSRRRHARRGDERLRGQLPERSGRVGGRARGAGLVPRAARPGTGRRRRHRKRRVDREPGRPGRRPRPPPGRRARARRLHDERGPLVGRPGAPADGDGAACDEVEVDERFRMRPDALAEAMAADAGAGLVPWCVVAAAGSTNTGAVDDLPAPAARRRRARRMASRRRRLRRLPSRSRIAAARRCPGSSWPTPSCSTLTSRSTARSWRASCSPGAARTSSGRSRCAPTYLKDMDRYGGVNFADRGIELSRPFRALKVWLTVKTFGMREIRAALDRSLDLGLLAAELIAESPRLELVTGPSLGVVNFRSADGRPGRADDGGGGARRAPSSAPRRSPASAPRASARSVIAPTRTRCGA